jgi:hypothetical protein
MGQKEEGRNETTRAPEQRAALLFFSFSESLLLIIIALLDA